MAENKKGFILYCDLIHTIEQLPNEKAGELFKHILRYVNDQNPITDDLITNITFEPIKQQLKRDLVKYEDKRIQWSEAGKASAEKKRLLKLSNERSTESTNVENVATESTVIDTVIVKAKDKVNNRDAAKAATLKRIYDFKESLYPFTKSKGGIYENEMVKKFFDYWSETNKSETKMRWELETTWVLSSRLIKWKTNEDNFIKNGKQEKTNDHVY